VYRLYQEKIHRRGGGEGKGTREGTFVQKLVGGVEKKGEKEGDVIK